MKTEKQVRLGKDELVGFDRFVAYHYQESWRKAQKIVSAAVLPQEASEAEAFQMAKAVFDKLASPLVFLKTAWRNELSDTQRLAYYPDAEERAEKGRRLADEAKAMITQ